MGPQKGEKKNPKQQELRHKEKKERLKDRTYIATEYFKVGERWNVRKIFPCGSLEYVACVETLPNVQ